MAQASPTFQHGLQNQRPIAARLAPAGVALPSKVVPTGGLEPPRPKPLEPKPSASTNSARWAGTEFRQSTRRSAPARVLRQGAPAGEQPQQSTHNGVRPCPAAAMLATFAGLLALPLGLGLVLLPLLATELSRPRDSSWGGVVLLLGLVLVTSAERLSGAPMLAVLSGGLLIGRLGLEVGQGRWRQLSPEEQQRLGSLERWTTSLGQLGITLANLAGAVGRGAGQLGAGLGRLTSGRAPAAQASGDTAPSPAPARAGGRSKGKRWVRPEPAVAGGAAEAGGAREAGGAAEAGGSAEASVTEEASVIEKASDTEEAKNLTAPSAPASPTAQPADVEPAAASAAASSGDASSGAASSGAATTTAAAAAAASAAAAPTEAPSEANSAAESEARWQAGPDGTG